jgi:hypothetical protein
MRGGSLAVLRQAYGFTAYIQLLDYFEKYLNKAFYSLNKYVGYSLSSVAAKTIAMTL